MNLAGGWINLGGLPRTTFDAIYAAGPDAIIGGVFAPAGTAVPVSGGYRVSGRWAFASGCEDCQWLFGNCMEDRDGAPQLRTALFSPDQIEIEDTWVVSGLCGTGSHHLVARDVFVPAERTCLPFADPPCLDEPLLRMPMPPVFGFGVANSVTMHNDLVRSDPELAAALYEPFPYDLRGEQAPGARGWYTMPICSRRADRLFIRYIRPFIESSRRHDDAPRPSELGRAAMDRLDALCADPQYRVAMGLRPGDMQFINNYHVMHGRTAYQDDRAAGAIRHLKRLWLETDVLKDRPPYFANHSSSHWNEKRSASRMQVH